MRVPGLKSDTPLIPVPVPLLFTCPPTHLPSFIHPSSAAHLSAHSLSHSAALSPTHLSVLQPTHTSNQTTYLSIRPPRLSHPPSIRPLIYPSMHLYIHPPTSHSLTSLSIHTPTCPFIHTPNHPLSYPPTDQLIHLPSISPPTCPPLYNPIIYPISSSSPAHPLHSTFYPPMDPPIH